MRLIITSAIYKAEFEVLEKTFTLNVVKVAAKKALCGIGDRIKSSVNILSTTLAKVPLTGAGGAGRAIFLLKIADKIAVLVMIRMKNDKKIGANMSVQNPKFRRVLEKYLTLIVEGIKRGDFEEFEL